MPRPNWLSSVRTPKAGRQGGTGSRRDRIAAVSALVTAAGLVSVFLLSKGTAFLMPGPLASVHGAIESCGTCHTKSGNGKLSWIHGLVAGDPLADSKACLTCHKMPETAFNAHGASTDVLKQSTERLRKTAARLPQPHSARAQNSAFPTGEVSARGLYCATCHQEHQGTNFKLSKITSEQCRSCHVAKFNSFDSDHPKFENYPFERRTRIVYDHAAHFGKHYPEVAKKDPDKRIPGTCSTCHNGNEDEGVMPVAPFEQTCATCHLNQIKGNERASGPKGIAFLALPGLDLQSLKQKNAATGEWPGESEAALTPFMKLMIGRTEKGRALIAAVDGLNLQDLTQANEDEIKAVTDLVWEIKTLFHALISGKATDALGGLDVGGGEKPSASLVVDLTASIPRDVVSSAQQQWLPNLAAEIANGPGASNQKQDGGSAIATEPEVTGSAVPDEAAGSDRPPENLEPNEDAAVREETSKVKRDPPACALRLLGQCLVSQGPKVDDGKKTRSAKDFPGRMNAGAGAAAPPSANEQPQKKAADQADDLLFLTEDEQREISAHNKNSGKAGPSSGVPASAAANSDAAPANSQSKAAPVVGIESGLDAESWAEHGGWYQQDHAIFYRPAGHKDKFITSWLTLTGPQAPKGGASPAAAVFDFLTNKDAQGSCTKCHSVEDVQGKGRVVNFAPLTAKKKQGRFTRFIHEPHFGVIGSRGCLTCHNLETGRPYLKSYEQGNPLTFASEFSAVKKDLCQNCHTSSMARQDCLTCHKYHVNDAITPITTTKNPIQ